MRTELLHLKNKIYYSQNREDLILEAFFPNENTGFYVDVGAYDPDVDSVTKLFYLKGWSGINVEPQVTRYKKFLRTRPRDSNVQCGISSDEGERTLRIYKNGGLSTFSEKLKEEYTANEMPYQDVTIEVKSLSTLFRQHGVSKISFMKIDVEGLEGEVLKSNDWKQYRPEVLCIEANHITNDWRPYIKKQGYELVFDDGLNEYYTDTATSRADIFDYVTHVVAMRGGGIAYRDYKVAKEIDTEFRREQVKANQLREDNGKLQGDIAVKANQLREDNGKLQGDIAVKDQELEETRRVFESPRLLARKLVRVTLNRIMRR